MATRHLVRRTTRKYIFLREQDGIALVEKIDGRQAL
jgi:hypothetical protein